MRLCSSLRICTFLATVLFFANPETAATQSVWRCTEKLPPTGAHGGASGGRTFFTTSPVPSPTNECEAHPFTSGSFNRISPEAFSRWTTNGSPDNPRSQNDPEGQDAATEPDITARTLPRAPLGALGTESILVDWSSQEVRYLDADGGKPRRKAKSRRGRRYCSVSGSIRAANAGPVSVTITRGSLTKSKLPLFTKRNFAKTAWKTTVPGACRNPVVTAEPISSAEFRRIASENTSAAPSAR